MNSFFDGRLFKDYLDELKAEIKHKIDDKFDSNLDEDEFCEYIISTYVISEIIIDERKIVKLPARETIRHRNYPIFNESVEVPAIQITIEIPFQGPREYLTFKPSSRLLGMNPKGRIFEDRIHLYFESSDSNPQHLNNRIKNTIDEVLTNYKNILNEIKKFNENLDQYIRFMIRKRGERMAQIKEFVKSIDFPLQKREEVPPTIPIKRRRIVIEKPVPLKRLKNHILLLLFIYMKKY